MGRQTFFFYCLLVDWRPRFTRRKRNGERTSIFFLYRLTVPLLMVPLWNMEKKFQYQFLALLSLNSLVRLVDYLELCSKTFLAYSSILIFNHLYLFRLVNFILTFHNRKQVTGGLDKAIRIWSTESNELIGHLNQHRDAVTGLKFRKGHNQLYSSSYDRTVKVWNVDEKSYVETL